MKQDRASIWQELEDGIKAAGLSVPAFAKWVFGERNELGGAEDEERFVAKFKKQLQRGASTTGMLKRAENYLKTLYQHPDYVKRTGKVSPRSINYPEMDEKARMGMRRVSRMIDERLRFEDE